MDPLGTTGSIGREDEGQSNHSLWGIRSITEDEMVAMQDRGNDESSPGFGQITPEEGTEFVQNQGSLDDVDEKESTNRYGMREVNFKMQNGQVISFNPAVSLISSVVLWLVSIICMAMPTESNRYFIDLRGLVTLYFTWFFVGSKCVFFFFLIWIVFKYGGIKMGAKDDLPSFNNASYFGMIFSCGVAVGLFAFGASEPLSHRESNYYANSGFRSQDEVDLWAINLTVTHWNIAGWASYSIVAISMALAGYRFNLPMTFRSCFYPIFGDATWGWIGDSIDSLTIVVTIAGVCTSLGIGVIELVSGFQYLGWVDESSETTARVLTIWVITSISTASVLSGLDCGIKYLSLLALLLAVFLEFVIFAMDDTKFLLNLIVQEIGVYFQNSIFLLNFYTGPFGQLETGGGRAVDDRAEEADWVNAWAIFYQVWFSIWGGIAIRQARQAEEIKLFEIATNQQDVFRLVDRPNCYHVPDDLTFSNHTVIGVTPVCLSDNNAAYNLLFSYSFPGSLKVGLGPFLSVIFILSLCIFFATSSDSGSLVVDILASNGSFRHHWGQRLVWALTEGAVATALLLSGDSSSLVALQAAAIIAGLPFALLLCYQVQTIFLFCKQAAEQSDPQDYVFPNQEVFPFAAYGGVFDYMEYLFDGCRGQSRKVESAKTNRLSAFVIDAFVPVLPMYRVLRATYPKEGLLNQGITLAYGLCFYTSILLFSVSIGVEGFKGLAAALWFAAGGILMWVRSKFRGTYDIRSNAFADFVVGTFLWFQALGQMEEFAGNCDSKKMEEYI